jgi:E3 ubiquitin-protein ligase HUWE1
LYNSAIPVVVPEGTAEFMDCWLVLAERMTNPKTMLESPHALPKNPPANARNFKPFNPLHYLVNAQRETFHAIRKWLWNRTPNKAFGSRISESVLSILCHIIKGEAMIRVG